jgi:lysozyme
LIKSFESCSLKSYQDQKGIWTIGWGHTNGVRPGMTCNQAAADSWLIEDLAETEHYLTHILPQTVNANQFSASVSLVFNIGVGNFLKSDLLKNIKSGEMDNAADQFLVWDQVNGSPNPGLLRRRQAERTLFLMPVYYPT